MLRSTAALLALTAACKIPVAKPPSDTGDTGGGGEGDSGTLSEEPVWEDLRLETNLTFTAGYASGAGFYAVTEEGQAWVRQEGAWTRLEIDVDEEDINGLWGTGAGDAVQLVAVGDAGYISTMTAGVFASEDVGTANFESVSGPSIADLAAVGWGGIYLNTTGAWVYEDLDFNAQLNHVWYNGNALFAVGEDGLIVKRDAEGAWSRTQINTQQKLYGVSGTANRDMWAVGEDGVILHFDGTTWVESDSGTNQSLWAVHAVSETEVYAVGGNGTALTYDGTAWKALPTGVTNNLYHVTVSADGIAWAMGNRGAVLRYTP